MKIKRGMAGALAAAAVILAGGALFLFFRGGSGGYQVDGQVTGSEIAGSMASGRFVKHGPGDPPPVGDPATYCYIGRTAPGSTPALYVAFVCHDPHPEQIVANVRHNLPFSDNGLIKDDTVEIFLDPENDRDSYYQLIVNSRGFYSATIWASKQDYLHGAGRPWKARAAVKTSVKPTAGQWVCEVLIPFEAVGGAPAKGARWAVNVCRNFRGQNPEGQLQTWFDVYADENNYHNLKDFGVITW